MYSICCLELYKGCASVSFYILFKIFLSSGHTASPTVTIPYSFVCTTKSKECFHLKILVFTGKHRHLVDRS
jgi:hypothetical protein